MRFFSNQRTSSTLSTKLLKSEIAQQGVQRNQFNFREHLSDTKQEMP